MWYHDSLLFQLGTVQGPILEDLHNERFVAPYQPNDWQCHIPLNLRDLWQNMNDDCRMIAFFMAQEQVHDALGR